MPKEFRDRPLGESAQSCAFVFISRGHLENRVLRRTAVLRRPEMGSQMVDSNWHVRMIDGRTLRNRFNAGTRSVFVSIEGPYQVVAIFAFVPFVNCKGFQHDEREKISYSRNHRLLDTAMVQQFSMERYLEVV